ncbi:50S ribosomal protein L5 [Candidatus Nomurabacteria bacterium]|uniref:Large ribosomal subunit protein uL5 n=1 Tax=candidate division WWE3 bacterium TaxID=2053526 RepID=A0A955IX12_UNCKA|nr:50S ribosomal protein L5 [candidate division WWE3 bacterium]MCB9823772.1 50S ribosomal protein L5 [Candidatus Nomurabacteria bacterium]MCB9826822.1 50S ribosomal protein L5 [Candidatus Nomurabacteria bacterium]MCB9827567.1 50S ribosomal protein L5 [Candidatus Nomurabacteria bacterium]HXK52983.1 50S ribosomal protein L5 [bacterium]
MSLRDIYKDKIANELVKDLGLTNLMQAPKLSKIVINAGIGPFRESKEAVDSFVEELSAIAGQKPIASSAKKSEAGFKIRQGDVVGYSVTLRDARMWAFFEKFVNIVMPRVRDFNGLSLASFDGSGNYSVGIKEHTVFPEVNPNKVKGIRSIQVTFCIKNGNKQKSTALLKKLGMPFKKEA